MRSVFLTISLNFASHAAGLKKKMLAFGKVDDIEGNIIMVNYSTD